MIRGFFSAIIGVLLVLSLIVFGITWDLSSSLSYTNVEKNVANTALNLIGSQTDLTQQINNNLPLIKEYCAMGKKDISLTYQGMNITISCNDVNESASQLINNTLDNMIKNIYYANYSCSYWDCFNSTSSNGLPLFLISEKSQIYWRNIFYYSIISSVLLIAGFVLLSKNRKSSSLPIGIFVALGALPLLAIQKVVSSLPSMVSGISSVFFSQSSYVFIRMIIAAGVLIAAGIIVKIIAGGSKVYALFKKKEENKNPPPNQKDTKKTKK